MKNLIYLILFGIFFTSCKTYILRGDIIYSDTTSSIMSIYGENRVIKIPYKYPVHSVVEVQTKSLDKIIVKKFDVRCLGGDIHCHFGSGAHIRTHIKPIGGQGRTIIIDGKEYTMVEVREDGTTKWEFSWISSETLDLITIPRTGHVIFALSENTNEKAKLNDAYIILDYTDHDNHH